MAAESLFPRWRSRTAAGTVAVLRGTPVLPPGPAAAPASVASAASAAPVHRLWARCDGDGGPRRYWLTDLAEDAPGVLALLDAASATRSTVDRLGSDFGLLDFSGRSYTGWHHHMTLVSAAYALGRDLAVRVGSTLRHSA